MEDYTLTSHMVAKEACMAICAIVHANINESESFIQSSSTGKAKISSIGRHCFSDKGVIVELDNRRIYLKLHVSIKPGDFSIYKSAFELQQKMKEEVLLLTTLHVQAIDITITGIHGVE